MNVSFKPEGADFDIFCLFQQILSVWHFSFVDEFRRNLFPIKSKQKNPVFG